MAVLCMGNLPWPKQMSLSVTHCKRAHHCYTAREDHFIEGPVAPSIARLDISKFLSFGLPEEEIVQE
jgi:4'-phosphopantetheinyl transferase EntD